MAGCFQQGLPFFSATSAPHLLRQSKPGFSNDYPPLSVYILFI